MKNKFINFILITVICTSLAGLNGCKSTKKMAGATKPKETTESTESQKPAKETQTPKTTNEKATVTATDKLETSFNAIATSSSLDAANDIISQTLKMFASGDVPVIIAFFKENGIKDYDEPTTITKYLNYLKDLKKNPNKIENVITGDDGKIVELDLIKR